MFAPIIFIIKFQANFHKQKLCAFALLVNAATKFRLFNELNVITVNALFICVLFLYDDFEL